MRLTDAQAHEQLKSKTIWHRSITPIPDRGDELTRANRIHNLRTAIKELHNYAIPAGQTFSLSNLIGEPTTAKGYRSGPAFIKGEVGSDIGGGLCLIATNLYQLFLYGGCKILERHNHSIDAYGNERFYKLGEDAAISHGTKDLVIRNTFAVPLLLQIDISGQVVESRLYGNGQNPLVVHVESMLLERLNPDQRTNHQGWAACTMRLTRARASQEWVKDYTSFSYYKPF